MATSSSVPRNAGPPPPHATVALPEMVPPATPGLAIEASWIPFALEGLDWAWGNSGVKAEHPEYELLPSEYFKRQIFGCFFFESFQAVQYSIERLGDQQILFETDFPHPTAQVPGPGVGVSARDFVEREFTQLSDTSLARILHDNAARLYGL